MNLMKKILIPAFIFYCSMLYGQNNACNCYPTTPKERQDRSSAKHETNYGIYKLKKDTISVEYIYGWGDLYYLATKSISKKAENPKSIRKHNTPEDSLYILKGYMWFVKTEDNDCDFHIEIGPKNIDGDRIIIEVPVENIKTQQKIKDYLNKHGLKIMGCGTSNSKKAHFDKGIPVVVVGLGFYDASHKPDTNHGDKHTKKHSWELHPVKEIYFH